MKILAITEVTAVVPGCSNVRVGDELNVCALQPFARLRRGQELKFDLARLEQARVYGSQVVIAIAGMADKLPGPVRKGLEYPREKGGVERPGGGDADSAVGREKAGAFHEPLKFWLQKTKRTGLNGSFPADAPLGDDGGERLGWLEGIAESWYAANARSAQHAFQHGRKQVGVLVGVEVGEGDAGVLEASKLCCCFRLDLAAIEATGESKSSKTADAVAELRTLRGDERGKPPGISDWRTVDQYHMAADAETRVRQCECRSFGGRRSVRHHCGGAENALRVGFDDRAIDPGGEPEVVGIKDEAAHVNESSSQK